MAGTLHILKPFTHISGCHWKPAAIPAGLRVIMPCENCCGACIWDLDHFITEGAPATDVGDFYKDTKTGEPLASLAGYVRFEAA